MCIIFVIITIRSDVTHISKCSVLVNPCVKNLPANKIYRMTTEIHSVDYWWIVDYWLIPSSFFLQ